MRAARAAQPQMAVQEITAVVNQGQTRVGTSGTATAQVITTTQLTPQFVKAGTVAVSTVPTGMGVCVCVCVWGGGVATIPTGMGGGG